MTWLFPFRLKALRYQTARHRWAWQHERHMPRSWLLIRAQRFLADQTLSDIRKARE